MASLSFTSIVLDAGTTFIFGSCICAANGLGGFNSHRANSSKPEASAATRRSNLYCFIDSRRVVAPQSTQADRKDVRFQHDFNLCYTMTTRIGFKPI
jgi:hypothetical protein